MTAIEWTDETWNPVTGCSKVSPGCDHCYAEALSLRYGWSKKPWSHENAAENVVLHPERLRKPSTWKTPRMVFVNSMSDLFHENIPADFVWQVIETMAGHPQHTFQVLTKRPKRMADLVGQFYDCNFRDGFHDPIPNIWLGVSIESWRFNWRADVLRETPAAIRFISAEPLLEPLYTDEDKKYRWLNLEKIDWLIVGGESGPRHRPIEAQWVRDLRDEALHCDTAFFFKQWGGRTPKAGGRELDGRTWDQYPRTMEAAA